MNFKWQLSKKLSTSIVNKDQLLGSLLCTKDSLIVAKGMVSTVDETYDDILFIYRQLPSGEWPTVETNQLHLEELYTKNVRILEMDVNDEGALAIIYRTQLETSSELKIKIINLKNNNLLASETLNKEDKFYYGLHTKILFTNSTLFISNSDYTSPDRSIQGIVHVFEKDKDGNWSLNPTARLTSSIKLQYNFGITMDFDSDKLYVANSGDESLKNGLFIYRKPETGWTDTTENSYLQKEFFYGNRGINLTVNDGVIFWSVPEVEENFNYYMPDSGNENDYKSYQIQKPLDVGDEYLKFGYNPIYQKNQLFLNTRHSISQISNRVNENIIIYDFDIHSPDVMVEYSNILNSQFYSASDDEFGSLISVSRNTLAVSANGSSNKWGNNSGSVYLYERLNDQWVFDQEIIAPEQLNNESFAKTFEIQNDYLFIGSPAYDSLDGSNKYYNTGKVYIYKKQNDKWSFHASLVSPLLGNEEARQGSFGRNITYSNGKLAISEISDNYGSSEAEGRVYFYNYDENTGDFIIDTYFENNEQYGLDYFGSNVVINEKYVVIGTGNSPTNVNIDNNVYVYKINSKAWKDQKADFRFASKINNNRGKFGESIAIKNDLLLVGETVYNNGQEYEGSDGRVYGFRIPENSTLDKVNYEDFYIEPLNNEDYTDFGSYIAINANDLFIKAKDKSLKSIFKDVLYTFDLKNLNEADTIFGNNLGIIRNPDGNSDSGFGNSVEVNNGFLLVGSPDNDTESGFESGSVHVFELESLLQPIPNLCNNIDAFELIASPKGGRWSLGDSIFSGNVLNVSNLEAGQYTINYDLNGCVQSSIFQVKEYTNLNSKADSVIRKCVNVEVPLFIEVDDTGKTFSWYYKEKLEDRYEFLDSAKSLTTIRTKLNGFFKIKMMKPECNEIEEEFQVLNIDFQPLLNVEGEMELCETEKSLNIKNIEDYESIFWYFKDENSSVFHKIEEEGPEILAKNSGEYFSEIVIENCKFLTENVSLTFKSNPKDLFVPNVATVNNDGYNDYFRIETSDLFNNFSIIIFNRYGKKVFQSFDQDFKWAAENTYSGNYLYHLKYETECGEIGERKGWIQMLK